MTTVPTTYYSTIAKVAKFLNLYVSVRPAAPASSAGSESVGTGDSTTTVFYLAHYNVIPDSESIYVAGTLKTVGVDYSLDADGGFITFLAGKIPTNAQAIAANYDYTGDNGIQPSTIGSFINRAEAEINQRTGRGFYTSATQTDTLDGNYVAQNSFYAYTRDGDFLEQAESFKPGDEANYVGRTIHLRYWPILTVTSITIDSALLGSTDYATYGQQGYIVLTSSGGQLWNETDLQNISIVYTYGYASVPPLIEDLATRLAARNLLEANVMGDPGQKLDILKQNISVLNSDIERLYMEYGAKLEMSRI